MEARTARGVALHPQIAAMRLGDGSADRQPHTHAARLGRDEWLEELVGDLLRNSGPGVRHDDLDHPLGIRSYRDGELAPAGALHRIHSVAQQVNKDLLDLDAIDHHRLRLMVELEIA